ncbi:hypothetical protein D3C76_1301510 [compost metagenome]
MGNRFKLQYFFHALNLLLLVFREAALELFVQLPDVKVKRGRFVSLQGKHGKIKGVNLIHGEGNRGKQAVLQNAVPSVPAVFGIYRHSKLLQGFNIPEGCAFGDAVFIH